MQVINLQELRPGMRVRIVEDPADIPYIDPGYKMVKWCGQVVTVLSVNDNSIEIEEDKGEGPEHQGGHWLWSDRAIECIIEESDYPDFDIASQREIFSFIFDIDEVSRCR